ncbi:MAG: hypothetical protein PHH67_02520 [Methanosarcina sp.]|nr:hypothetical protein [Methanosarcina sp.]MDD3316338.1 hypothetical protein [Methanosarcina sp.]MDD4305381.1 hypothetical protein [Methanosarcina sp.]MDD4620432.1 hypothetical protein [Methanosarcina sp.]NLN43669.1 hypothetical protein [Methanosarcina sp.]
MKRITAPKENSNGIIPIFKEVLTAFSQCFDPGRKYLNKSSRSKTAVATDAPSGIPGITVAENAPADIGLDIVELVSVVRTP